MKNLIKLVLLLAVIPAPVFGQQIQETAGATVLKATSATKELRLETPGATDVEIVVGASTATAKTLTLSSAGNLSIPGTISSTGTAAVGSVVAGADTACNTTCVSPCSFGQNTATFAIVACTDATADVCYCLGAS
jgi:hypothetical protein